MITLKAYLMALSRIVSAEFFMFFGLVLMIVALGLEAIGHDLYMLWVVWISVAFLSGSALHFLFQEIINPIKVKWQLAAEKIRTELIEDEKYGGKKKHNFGKQ